MTRYIRAGKGRAVLLEEHEDPAAVCNDDDVAIQTAPSGFVLMLVGEGAVTELQRCPSLDDAFESAIVAIHFLSDTYTISRNRLKH